MSNNFQARCTFYAPVHTHVYGAVYVCIRQIYITGENKALLSAKEPKDQKEQRRKRRPHHEQQTSINTIKVGKQRYSTYLIKGHNVMPASWSRQANSAPAQSVLSAGDGRIRSHSGRERSRPGSLTESQKRSDLKIVIKGTYGVFTYLKCNAS